MASRAFISHVSEEAEVAAGLKTALARDFLGLLDVFVSSDAESIAAGEEWLRSIERALKESAMLIVLCAPSRSALFVPPHSVSEFPRRGLADLQRLHRPSTSRSMRRFTSDQGSSRIVPASIAAIRRSISAFHAASASGSAGPSRLASNSAASSARASGSRRKASAKTSVTAFGMPSSYGVAPRLPRN